MMTQHINSNMITYVCGPIPTDIKYIGEDLWAYDDKNELVMVRLHVYSKEAAGSKILKESLEILGYCKPEIELVPFSSRSVSHPVPEFPHHHLVYQNNLIAVYPEADYPSGEIRVYRPCPNLFVLTDSNKILYCIFTHIEQCEIQVGKIDENVSLAGLSPSMSLDVISLLSDDWIYNDTDRLLPFMIKKWEPKLRTMKENLPSSLVNYLDKTVQYWREMSE